MTMSFDEPKQIIIKIYHKKNFIKTTGTGLERKCILPYIKLELVYLYYKANIREIQKGSFNFG